MRTVAAGRITSCFTALAVLMVLALSLAGCAGGAISNAFSSADSNTLDPISFAQIIGPPAAVSDQLTRQLISAAKQKNIPVITEKGKPATYTVRGYLAQSNERKSEKITYIWDVTDQSGKRVHRILGEETVPAKPGAKPWMSINQATMQKIAAKTANDLALWLPSQKGGASATRTTPASTPVKRKPAPAASTRSRTASTRPARSGAIVALVPPVRGAPGDGRTALTNAIRQRLRAKGVRIASTSGRDVYKINGKVTMRNAGSGKQNVKIEWQLLSSTGRDLGSVTQQTDVPKGSLDKTWGPAATSAGNAAANEILKLIAKSRG